MQHGGLESNWPCPKSCGYWRQREHGNVRCSRSTESANILEQAAEQHCGNLKRTVIVSQKAVVVELRFEGKTHSGQWLTAGLLRDANNGLEP